MVARASASFVDAMRDDPAKTISSYETLTAPEITYVVENWQTNREKISLDTVLRVFLYHLDGKKVPKQNKPPTGSGNDPSDRAWAAIGALHYRWSDDFRTCPALRTQLSTAWVGVFKWCNYLYTQRVGSGQKTMIEAASAITRISLAIRHLLSDGELHAKIRATDGIITLCSRLCLHAAAPLQAFIPLSFLAKFSWDDLDEIVASVGSDHDTVAKIIVERLRRVINTTPFPADVVGVFLLILVGLVAHPQHSLTFFVLLDHNAIWVVTRALDMAAEALQSANVSDSRLSLLTCVGSALIFLRAGLVELEPPKLVSQSIDAGLLHSICILSVELDKPDVAASLRNDLRAILGTILPQSMMFLSVIKIMKREHRDIDPDLVDLTIGQSYLTREWYTWILLLLNRSQIAKLPKEIKGVRRIGCDNPACGKTGRRKELLRCSGCLYVYYCSKACQKAAWKNHKPMCRLKKDAHATRNQVGFRTLFTEQDARFLRETVSTESHIHFHHLKKLAQRTKPNEPVENHVIGIDYTNPKYPAGTCYLKNIKTYTFPPVDKDALDPANVAAQNEEMINIVRRNPRSYTFIEAVFMHGKDKLTRNFVFRPNIFANGSQFPAEHLDWQNNRCENNASSMPDVQTQLLELMIKGTMFEENKRWESEIEAPELD
ncbi:MYND-type domain-containing protein [Mycena indigotica]|uniref:MYND-type domain-containing protein n=1 Tax=Mycena indigotica TaxID=2126181 RepID=A0A8H6SZT8_9AGAR|nr:MYND-type domain-containing protein [Mycena indigotica]KAF7309335.1 MYND-type domain-containing protein [Mycena indigotica]